MIVFMVFATGAAISLSVFYLGLGLAGFAPDFDRRTVDRVGIMAALVLYCGAGPVLLVRALDRAEVGGNLAMIRNVAVLTFLILSWAGALGVVAVESAQLLL